MTHFVIATAAGELRQACSSTQPQDWIEAHWPRETGEVIVWVSAPPEMPLSAWRVVAGAVVPAEGGEG